MDRSSPPAFFCFRGFLSILRPLTSDPSMALRALFELDAIAPNEIGEETALPLIAFSTNEALA